MHTSAPKGILYVIFASVLKAASSTSPPIVPENLGESCSMVTRSGHDSGSEPLVYGALIMFVFGCLFAAALYFYHLMMNVQYCTDLIECQLDQKGTE